MKLGDTLPQEAKGLMMEHVTIPGHRCDGKLVRLEHDTLTCQKCGHSYYAPQKKGNEVSKQGFKIEYPIKRR